MRQAPDQSVLNALAAEIKSRRSSLQISQEELAYRAGVHRTFVAKLEIAKNQPTLSVLFRLAGALEVDAQELVAGVARRHKRAGQRTTAA